MTSYYYSRSLANVNKLADNTKAAARKLLDWSESNGIEVLIYETIRTKEQQAANVASGASQTMRSYHLVGQALDFVMAKGKTGRLGRLSFRQRQEIRGKGQIFRF